MDKDAQLAEVIKDLGLTMDVEFVPWSRSRHACRDPKLSDRSLNWHVTLRTWDGTEILTTDYSAGIGHCPSYGRRLQLGSYYEDLVERETETGYRWVLGTGMSSRREKIEIKIEDVVSSVVEDAAAIDYVTFESWAATMDINPDSRKGEAMYRVCLSFGLALRAHLGEAGLEQLQEAIEEYSK